MLGHSPAEAVTKTGPQKAATVSQRSSVSSIAIKDGGRKESHNRVPQTNVRRRMAAVNRGGIRSKVGAIRKNAKDEQERSAEMLLGRFTALEPLAKGACFNLWGRDRPYYGIRRSEES